MELYQLERVLNEPCEDQGWLYMAETLELSGCRAWGETGATMATPRIMKLLTPCPPDADAQCNGKMVAV